MPVQSPATSKPFLVPTGTDLTGLTAFLLDISTGSALPMPSLGLRALSTMPAAPAGMAWVQLTGLPDIVPLGVYVAALTVLLSSDSSVLLQDTITASEVAIMASTGQAGPNPATVLVQDSLTNAPLVGVDLAVWSQDLETFISGPLTTDQSGQAVFGLPVGTYQILAFAVGTSFANPFQLVMPGGPVTRAIPGTKQIVAVPQPAHCTIYGFVLDATGAPLSGVAVKMTLDTTTPQMLENVGVSQDSVTVQTNELGYFEISALGGLKINLAIDDINFSKSGTLPATGLVTLEQLNMSFK